MLVQCSVGVRQAYLAAGLSAVCLQPSFGRDDVAALCKHILAPVREQLRPHPEDNRNLFGKSSRRLDSNCLSWTALMFCLGMDAMHEAAGAAAAINGQYAEAVAREQQGGVEQAPKKEGAGASSQPASVLPWLLTLDITAAAPRDDIGQPITERGVKQEQAGADKGQSAGKAGKVRAVLACWLVW